MTSAPPCGLTETAEAPPRSTTCQSAEYFAAAVVRMPSARHALAGYHVPLTPSVTGCGATPSAHDRGYFWNQAGDWASASGSTICSLRHSAPHGPRRRLIVGSATFQPRGIAVTSSPPPRATYSCSTRATRAKCFG